MRGTLTDSGPYRIPHRIIPADAGNTASLNSSYIHSRDHPRGCGEHWHTTFQQISGLGSSPRMRGTQEKPQQSIQIQGIIPADAGNTTLGSDWPEHGWDHPRGCGEHLIALGLPPDSWGSSPRMRGTLFRAIRCKYPTRIIPADAGNTVADCSRTPGQKDHPRGCGEHIAFFDGPGLGRGSSPRMRGTHSVF